MRRLVMDAGAIAMSLLFIAATPPAVYQVSIKEREISTSPSQIDAGQAHRSAVVEQASAVTTTAHQLEQITRVRAQAELGEQLGMPARRGGIQPVQLSAPGKTAEAPAPLTTRSEGKKTGVITLAGQDRCDAAAPRAVSGICMRVIETRAVEFNGPDPLVLSPEQRLLSQQPNVVTGSIQEATRRLGSDASSLSPMEQAVAATITRSSPDVPDREELESKATLDVSAIMQTIGTPSTK